MKKIFIFLILNAITIYAQDPVVLQPWMQVEGTYNGQRLGSSVGFAGNIFDSTIISVGKVNETLLYHIKTPDDTIPRLILPEENCSFRDFNGDGIKDLLVSGNPTKIYLGISPGVFDTIPFFVKHKEPEGDTFGRRVAVGKINGDIYDDLIIADDFYPNGAGNGRVYIFFGNTPMDTIPDFIIDGYNQSRLGFNVTAGDLNNDGYDDIIVKGRDFNDPNMFNRFPYIKIFLGGNTIDTTTWKYLKGSFTSAYGIASFDVNGDGIEDLLWTDWNPQDSLNYIKIHFSDGNIDTLPSLILKNPGVSNLGDEIKNAGDMNGDGYNDILGNAYRATIDAGYVFVFSGGPSMDNNFDAAVGMGAVSDFGYSIFSVGDISGDGYDDIVIGAPAFEWFAEKGYWGIFLGDSIIPVTSVEIEDIIQPKTFILLQNYPNPFNPKTVISYQLSVIGNVQIKIYDILGKEITVLLDEEKSAGKYEIEFDASKYNLSSGVYFYKITIISSDGKRHTKTMKMILLSETEKREQIEYEMQLWGRVREGDEAARLLLSKLMFEKTPPELRKFIIKPEEQNSEILAERTEQ